MIVAALNGDMPFYRAHSPRWASQPLSGAGAASRGGRLNRPGIHALYLSATQVTAIAEYQQGELLMPPCTVATYRVALASVVDFRAGYTASTWHPLWQELTSNWRKELLLDGLEPATWSISDMVLSVGHAGILYPSQRSSGLNLVVYVDALTAVDRLEVHDPKDQLPKNASSWDTPSA